MSLREHAVYCSVTVVCELGGKVMSLLVISKYSCLFYHTGCIQVAHCLLQGQVTQKRGLLMSCKAVVRMDYLYYHLHGC